MQFTLINAGPSPFGRKVAVALIEKRLPFSVRYDLPWSDQTCTGDFSPLSQLPILIAPDGETVYDSTFILEWLESKYPEPPLLPLPLDQRLLAKKRQMLGERLMEIAQNLIFELHRPEPSQPWVERQTKKVIGAFDELEAIYGARGNNTGLDLGDIAVATTLLLFEFALETGLSPQIEALRWRGHRRALTEAVATLERRQSFMETQPRHMELDLHATVA